MKLKKTERNFRETERETQKTERNFRETEEKIGKLKITKKTKKASYQKRVKKEH